MLVGIVGAPNSGKSTFFRALTLSDAETASYPFTTIEPNQGIAYAISECPCKRLGVECSPQNSKCFDGMRAVPVKVLDVAGLVPGAHEGKGMGNQFLNDLSQASGLIHVVDASGKHDWEGKHVDSWDITKTMEFVEFEIDEWIRGIIEKALQKVRTLSRTEKKPLETLLSRQLSGLGILEIDIKEAMKKSLPEEKSFAKHLRQISKPIIIAANKIDLPSAQKNIEKISNRKRMFPCSAESELALKEAREKGIINYVPGSSNFKIIGKASEKQARALEFIKNEVLIKYGSTGVQKCFNSLIFDVLEMIVVYPVADINKLSDNKGNVLPDAYIVPKGTTLKELAYRIHTEIGKKFIGGLDIKKRKIGADYVLKDRDVVEILVRK